MGIHIKRLLTEQFPAEGILADQFPDAVTELRAVFGNPDSRFLIAEDATARERIVGCGGFYHVTPEICEVKRLVVFWGHQAKGTGKRLLTFLIREAQQLGYRRMRVQVPAGTEALLSFYPRYGFREVNPFRPSFAGESCFFELDLSEVTLVPLV